MSTFAGKGDSVDSHNRSTYEGLRRGDLVEFHRGAYAHWAVYIGDGLVVHLAGDGNDGLDGKMRPEYVFTISGKTFNKAKVCMDKFWNVVLNSKAYINNAKDKKWSPLPANQIVAKAMSRLGEVGYSLVTSNCEHFAKWCRYGIEQSDQVDNYLTAAAVSIATGLTVGAIAKYWGATPATEKEEEEEN